MARYKLSEIDPDTGKAFPIIIQKENEAGEALTKLIYIPTYPANRNYAEYLEWVAEGNTPEAAD